MPGLFVTLEGGEGSGKSTQLAMLAARLRAEGRDLLVTREPGGTSLAEGVRALLLDHEHPPTALAETFLLEAARAEHVSAIVRPALAAGRIVLCDRFTDSTQAYQGGGRGLDRDLLDAMNRAATGGLEPELTLLFDVPVSIGLARRAAAATPTNRLDHEPPDFHERVRRAYLELARRAPMRIVVIDATGTAESVGEVAWRSLAERIARSSFAGGRQRG